MPSHLLKSSPVDNPPPVVVLPPNIVEVEVDGVTMQVDVYQALVCVIKEDGAETELGESEDLSQKNTPGTSVDPEQLLSPTPGKSQSARKSNKLFRKSIRKSEGKNGDFAKTPTGRKYKHHFQEVKKLPEAVFRVMEDYKMDDAPPRPNNAYIRYIERTPEELAEMVEYDLDELDVSWLQDQNRIRLKEGLPEVHQDVMELLMDRLEKESYFQMQSSGMEQGPIIDDDAVCCICMDGECQNANAILFCDMCNLAVHQECYGVPYIPEGQWLCRRCLLSPSIAVDCILCPNKGGAFKETECKRWAHVVCAIWIPEVCFANAVFLEPVDNIKSIPAARWRLCCFICKQKGVGACIQCYKSNCYTAFHVTCALQAGLCMRMETVRLASAPGVTVKKTAYCDTHAPPDFIAERDSGSETARQKLKQIRKMLAEKRCAPPVVSVPTIPPEQIAQISSSVNFTKKSVFMKKLMAYWKLKRMQRNGVPLLRRLQVASSVGSKSSRKYDASQNEVNSENYAEIMRIRQDLEKGRLLCELTRKREKIKREVINARIQVWDMRIQPFNYFLSSVVDDLCSKDSQSIFTQPVDPEHVPDYPSVVKNPMDLSTMQRKIFEFAYDTIDDLQADFQLMINNCKLYNSKDTVFYRAANKMQELGGIVFREAKRAYERIGFKGGVHTKIPPPQYSAISAPIDEAELQTEIENVIEDKERNSLKYEEHLHVLEETIDKCLLITHPASRKKKFLRVKREIYKLKKLNCLIEEGASGSGLGGDQSSMDEDEVAASPFDVESSDAAEEGREALGAGARTPRHLTSIRTRLRSTDAERSARLQQSTKVSPTSSRVLRRISKSSDTLPTPVPPGETIPAVSRFPSPPQPLPPPPPTAFILSSPNTSRLKHSEMGLPVGFKRGQGVKFPTQRGRRARLRSSSRTSPSPQRKLSTSPRLQRGGAHRGGRGRGRRNLRKPLRRSGRVAEQQQLLAQAAQVPSVNPSAKEEDLLREGAPSRQVSPTRSRELPKMTTSQRRTGSRHASPTQVAPPRISSSRTTSPIGSLNKSQRSTRQHSPVAPASTPIPITWVTDLVSSPRPNPVRTLPKRQASPTSSIGGKSQQVRLVNPGAGSPVRQNPVRAKAPPSPILGSPLKPHQMVPRSIQVEKRQQQQQSGNQVAPPKTRPTRDRLVKSGNNSSPIVLRTAAGTTSPKSMEAAAKSIVCEERILPRRQQVTANNVKATGPGQVSGTTGKLRRVQALRSDELINEGQDGALPPQNVPQHGAPSRVLRRNSSGKRMTSPVQNLHTETQPVLRKSPEGRKIKGPAAAVGRRKKGVNATGGVNGPLEGESGTGDLRHTKQLVIPATNGLISGLGDSAATSPRHLVGSMSPGKKRPKRSAAAVAAASSGHSGVYHNNSLVSGGSPSHMRKADSFSVYRSGGDHEINSYSEGEDEDDDEAEEEEEEDDVEDEEEDDEEEEEEEDEESVSKPVTASEEEEDDDDDEEEDEDNKAKADEPEEEAEEEGNSEEDEAGSSEEEAPDAGANEGGDSSASDNSSSDSDSSSSSSSLSSSTSNVSSISKASSSSSMTTPKHFHHVKLMKHKKKMRRLSASQRLQHRQHQNILPPQQSPHRTVRPQVASPNANNNNNNNNNSVSNNNNVQNNNNTIHCSNKEKDKGFQRGNHASSLSDVSDSSSSTSSILGTV